MSNDIPTLVRILSNLDNVEVPTLQALPAKAKVVRAKSAPDPVEEPKVVAPPLPKKRELFNKRVTIVDADEILQFVGGPSNTNGYQIRTLNSTIVNILANVHYSARRGSDPLRHQDTASQHQAFVLLDQNCPTLPVPVYFLRRDKPFEPVQIELVMERITELFQNNFGASSPENSNQIFSWAITPDKKSLFLSFTGCQGLPKNKRATVEVRLLDFSYENNTQDMEFIQVTEGYHPSVHVLINKALRRFNCRYTKEGIFHRLWDGEEVNIGKRWAHVQTLLGETQGYYGIGSPHCTTVGHISNSFKRFSKISKIDLDIGEDDAYLGDPKDLKDPVIGPVIQEVIHYRRNQAVGIPLTAEALQKEMNSVMPASVVQHIATKIHTSKKNRVLAHKYNNDTFREALGDEVTDEEIVGWKEMFEERLAENENVDFFLMSSSKETIVEAIEHLCTFGDVDWTKDA